MVKKNSFVVLPVQAAQLYEQHLLFRREKNGNNSDGSRGTGIGVSGY